MIICSYVSKKFPPDWPLAYLFWRSAVSRWIPQCHPDSQHASHQVRISCTHFPWYTTFQHRQVMCNANVKGWFLIFINATIFLPFIWCITRRGKRHALVYVIHNVVDCNLMQVLESTADKGRPKWPVLRRIHLDPRGVCRVNSGCSCFYFFCFNISVLCIDSETSRCLCWKCSLQIRLHSFGLWRMSQKHGIFFLVEEATHMEFTYPISLMFVLLHCPSILLWTLIFILMF